MDLNADDVKELTFQVYMLQRELSRAKEVNWELHNLLRQVLDGEISPEDARKRIEPQTPQSETPEQTVKQVPKPQPPKR